MPELPRGYGQAGDLNVDKGRAVKGPRIFWLPPGGETTITILDEPPVRVVRHKLFLRRDNVAARMRQTCWGWNPDGNKDPCPRECLVCNASLKYPRKIGRDGLAYVTIIDEREFTYNNKQYKDMKMLLELDAKGFDSFSHLARTYGQMKFRRFKVYRSQAPKGKPQTSAKHGDHWTDLGVVNPTEHFWYSPAIKGMMESSQRRGEQPKDHAATVAELISPIDYGQEIGTYKPEEASQFVGYLEGQLGAQGGGGGWQSAPPIPGAPGAGVPGGFAPAPGAVMPGQVPAYNPPTPPSQPPAAPAAPPPFPGTAPAAPQAPPTHVGPPAPAHAPPAQPQAPATPPAPAAPGTPPAPPPWAATPPPPPGVQPPAGAQAPPPPPTQQTAPQPPTFGGTPLESVPKAPNPAQMPPAAPPAQPQAPPPATPAPPSQPPAAPQGQAAPPAAPQGQNGPPAVGGGYDFQQGWNSSQPGSKDEPF